MLQLRQLNGLLVAQRSVAEILDGCYLGLLSGIQNYLFTCLPKRSEDPRLLLTCFSVGDPVDLSLSSLDSIAGNLPVRYPLNAIRYFFLAFSLLLCYFLSLKAYASGSGKQIRHTYLIARNCGFGYFLTESQGKTSGSRKSSKTINGMGGL